MNPAEFAVVALPGLAAVASGVVRWRTWRHGRRTWRRMPPPARLAVLLLAVGGVAACHSIDQDVFAHGPVPLADLPFHEPVAYAVGPSAGEAVPAQHGLLGSYFNGADYVQPAHNEYLHHQQIDPQVDFTWDASDTNPVIPSSAGGIDHNDGDPRLPDHWPIWSIVWEGYLEAPADGTYGLRLHVNNGGWLEMKDPASRALTTVVDCPGGSSFEGDCDGGRELAAGLHYVRLSYYNNAPPGADAIFSWRPPGASAFAVVPTEALCTQKVAGCSSAQRGFIFIHGIRGSHEDTRSFRALLGPLEQLGAQRFLRFRYFQDVGDAVHDPVTGAITCRSRPAVIPTNTGGLPLTLTPHSLDPSICDSQSDVGLNAVLLDQDVRDMQRHLHGGKVTLIANSMGAAIVRAFLAYAEEARTGGLDAVDHVIFLQGAQQGSYLAYAKPAAEAIAVEELGPLLGSVVFGGAEDAVRAATGWDPTRPAVGDLTPVLSETYRYTNADPAHVPEGVGFVNVASEIHLGLDVGLFGYRFAVRGLPLGDYVLLPGSDDPRALPPLGGARFDPGVLGRRADHAQYLLERDLAVRLEAFVERTPSGTGIHVRFAFPAELLDVSESHLELGALRVDGSARMHEVLVVDRQSGQPEPLDDVLLGEIAREGAP